MKNLIAAFVLLFGLNTISGQQMPGFFNYEIGTDGKLELQFSSSQLNEEFLYVNSLSAGIGSNDIGLDRGQLGSTRVVKFIKAGNKILLVEPNLDYRAISDNQKERAAVEEAFAQSVIWGFTLKNPSSAPYKVDMSTFLMRDAHNVSGRLKRSKEGTYKLDKSKSALWEDRTKNFPDNTEFDVLLTFQGEPTGKHLRTVVPDPNNITVRQHHSFIRLPDNGYQKRVFHPYSAFNNISYYDYATPIHEPIEKKYIRRHRLEKMNPDSAVSKAVEPIVYYIDSGCPEPVKSALIKGGLWWDQAFQAAGYAEGTFQIKELPEGADPMDVRYNMIQWVHRSTRGWSYGASVTDPRTGEIIKGHVSLGSLRVRQDFMIAQGLLSPFENEDSNHSRMTALALARLNQLSAHEIGHTIGLSHNFAASYNDKSSVMDYPHPSIYQEGNDMNMQKAYDDKIGEWDKFTIRYGYGHYENEEQGLANLIKEAQEKGLQFISDRDARPSGGAHPRGHLWDNGTDIVKELDRMMEVRKKGLTKFGLNTITNGTPLSELEKVLVPLYYSQRYQAEAVARLVGGVDYAYSVKGDSNNKTVSPVDYHTQTTALNAILGTMKPDALALPQHILDLIPPPAHGFGKSRESFKSKTGLTFDPVSAAQTYTNHMLGFLLHHERLERINQQNKIYNIDISLDDYMAHIYKEIGMSSSGYESLIGESNQLAMVNHLIKLATDNQVSAHVAVAANTFLNNLQDGTSNFGKYIQTLAQKGLSDRDEVVLPEIPAMPPGSPIGCYQEPIN
jgi:hypothetical protein